MIRLLNLFAVPGRLVVMLFRSALLRLAGISIAGVHWSATSVGIPLGGLATCRPLTLLFVWGGASVTASAFSALLMFGPVLGALALAPRQSFILMNGLLLFGYSVGIQSLPRNDEVEYLVERFRCDSNRLSPIVRVAGEALVGVRRTAGLQVDLAYGCFIGSLPALAAWAFF